MRFTKLFLALALLTGCSTSRADLWLEGEYGASSASEHSVLGIELNYADDNKILSIGLTENTACFLWCLNDVFYSESYVSYGIRKQIDSFVTVTGQIGVSKIRRADFDCSPVCDESVLGIPLDVSVLSSAKYAGVGVNLRISLNRLETTAMISISTALGKIR